MKVLCKKTYVKNFQGDNEYELITLPILTEGQYYEVIDEHYYFYRVLCDSKEEYGEAVVNKDFFYTNQELRKMKINEIQGK